MSTASTTIGRHATNDEEQGIGPPEGWSRRELIRGLGLTSGGMLLLGPSALLGSSAAAVTATATAANMAIRNPAAPVRAVLELDGQSSYLLSVAGGNAVASITTEAPAGPGAIPNKHPTGFSFEDIVIALPLLASPTLSSWINDSLTKGPIYKDGAIAFADADGNALKRLQFSSALLMEIDLPVCDATQRNPAVLSLRLAPERTQWIGGSGKVQAFPFSTRLGAALAGNFNLSIQGLEAACREVVLVSGLTAKRTRQPSPLNLREPTLATYSPFDISTLRITLVEAYAAPFFSWFTNFSVQGNTGPGAERPGLLQWLTADLKTVIATAQLVNLGLVRYAPEPFNSEAAVIPRVQVDMYCEAIFARAPDLCAAIAWP